MVHSDMLGNGNIASSLPSFLPCLQFVDNFEPLEESNLVDDIYHSVKKIYLSEAWNTSSNILEQKIEI